MNTPRTPFHRRLSARLAFWVMLIALLLGIVTSAAQIFLDYFNVRGEFDAQTQQVITALKVPAAQAAYQMDRALATEVVNGLIQYDAIVSVKLLDNYGEILAENSEPLQQSDWRWASYTLFGLDPEIITPLKIESENQVFGKLIVVSDVHKLATSFWERSVTVFLSGIARNIVLAAIIFILFQALVTKPLIQLVNTLTHTNPVSPKPQQLRCPQQHIDDELGDLVHTTNKLLHAIHTHVSEREMLLNAANAASVEKSQFIAKISHELRTPLNAIIGYSEILEEELDEMSTDEARADIHKVHAAGTHLLNMVNDLLDISKIEAGRMEIHCEGVDVCPVLEEIISIIQPKAEKNNNRLSLQCLAKAELRHMDTDITKLRQCLLNLLDNACKYTQNGEVALIVNSRTLEGHQWFEFHVKDSGMGMSAEQSRHIFEAFMQADNSSTRNYDGTGLGLAITQKLAQLLGGEITVSSELGKGSCFSLCLPSLPVKACDSLEAPRSSTKV